MQTYSKEQAREHVSRLVESFRKVEATLGETQESEIENSYIRPLFEYLNWRTKSTGLRMSEREVVLVETDRQGKRPDYRFQLNGQHLFLMDAKKVKYSMHDPRWQWQVYRYAYSTRNNPAPRKVDFGILTNFREFILLDCTFEARKPEAVNNFRALDWRYEDYVIKFDQLWDIFERNNVLAASGDRKSGLWAYLRTPQQAKANRVAPDEGFLDKLDNDKNGWRVRLAKDMKKYSPSLTGEVITAAVQLLIDRLVFIKALSDRDIDDDYLAKLAECIETDGLGEDDRGWFSAAKPVFDSLNEFYDGSIFKSQTEEAVITSNRVVRDIIRELDPDNSPYDLSVLPVEILGTIYERFLGKVVRTTEQRVKIEDKPEVRKAGGVYYTPQYIVHYIVQQTVGKLLADCKTPEHVAKLKILDPACGSGSFLIGAYDALIEWYKSYYTAKAKPAREAAYRDAAGNIRLTAKLKRQILLDNLFGVDISQEAVEVTRFSLSLKALEDTRKDELDEERRFLNETVLPDLTDNIICGNSLIGTDILEGQLFEPIEERKLNPMNYKDKFPEIMERGGFDVVIGNPPYILLQDAFRDDKQLDYFRQNYKGASFKLDTYHLFIEQGIKLCRANGRLSLITPSNFLTNNHLDTLRRFILQSTQPEEVVVVDGGVFAGVSVDNAVFVFRAGQAATKPFPMTRAVAEPPSLRPIGEAKVNPARVLAEQHALFTSGIINPASHLWDRLAAKCQPLGDFADVNFGKQLRDRKKFLRDVIEVASRRAIPRTHIACVTGKDIAPYLLAWSKLACLNDTVAQSGGCWDETKHEAKGKLLTRQIGRFPSFAFDDVGYHCLNTIFMVTVREPKQIEPKYLLGILNSELLRALWTGRFYDQRQTFPKIKGTYLKELPIAFDSADKARHDKLVGLVEQMLEAKKAWAAAQTEKDKTYYDDKCKALDKQIDALVYELYGLTEEEISIVEKTRC